jgi:hypothetical protein
MDPLISARITALAVRDLVTARLGGSPVMVQTAGRPGEVALIHAPTGTPAI